MITSRFLRRLTHPISIVGLVILGVGFVASVISLAAELSGEESSPYQGLLTFVLYPGVAGFGLLVIGVGMILEHRHAKRLRELHEKWHPTLNLAERRARLIVWGLSIFTLAFVGSSIVGAYHAYEFTESKSFCGEVCHEPMEPQFVAHQNSPHSTIHCTTCHVGPGVGGYVDAKISGMRQLYQVVTDSIPRPIHAGEEKIQVVSQACEHCHQPNLMASQNLDTRVRYGFDLANTERSLRLLFKRSERAPEGTHWHAGLEVSFRATDERGQEIPWVKVRRSDGSETIYEDREWKETSAGMTLREEHTMACVDCHSRPAHRFETPERTINAAIADGRIDPTLPSIKKVAVSALARNHGENSPGAVREYVEQFYQDNFDGRVLAREESLGQAIATIQHAYSTSVFPRMHVNWTTYPDNTGHRASPGCFRCHGGSHESATGEKLVSDCSTCHVFFEKARDSESLTEITADGTAFHPFTNENHPMHECWTCHTESSSPYTACGECHEKQVGGHAMQFECSICHKPAKVTVDTSSCGPCHPMGGSPMHVHEKHGNCLDCHTAHHWDVPDSTCAAAGCHEGTDASYFEQHREEFLGVQFQLNGLPAKRTPKSR